MEDIIPVIGIAVTSFMLGMLVESFYSLKNTVKRYSEGE